VSYVAFIKYGSIWDLLLTSNTGFASNIYLTIQQNTTCFKWQLRFISEYTANDASYEGMQSIICWDFKGSFHSPDPTSSTCSSRAIWRPGRNIMLPAATFEMRKNLLTLSLAKQVENAKQFW